MHKSFDARVNIQSIRNGQGLQTVDPPSLPSQDIGHATFINGLDTHVTDIMAREVEMFIHRAVPSLTDGTFMVVEPGAQLGDCLSHILDITYYTGNTVYNIKNELQSKLCFSLYSIPVLQLTTEGPDMRCCLQIRHLPWPQDT